MSLRKISTPKTSRRSKKGIFRSVKRHNETLILVGLVLSIISLALTILPLLTEERLVIIQRIRVIELPPINDYHTSLSANIHVSCSLSVIVTRANGTVEYIQNGDANKIGNLGEPKTDVALR